MWNWLNCYLSGRHDFGVTCASGSIFLRCIHCGKRSNGWDVHNEHPALIPMTVPVIRQQETRGPRPVRLMSRDIGPEQRSA